MRIVRWAWVLLSFSIACGGAEPAAKTTSATSNWHPSPIAGATPVRIDATKSWADAIAAMSAFAGPNEILVWGDLVVDASVPARPVAITVGDDKLFEGYVLPESSMETFLKLQTMNPRFKAGHGGSADLKWRDGQLFLRRRWSAADVALGKLAPPPDGVFQHGEALAAIVSVDDPKAPTADVLAAIARAPTVFVFAMLPLH